MRSSEEIKRLIIDVGKKDDRVRAILLNGSRANDKISPDKYQDFDIVYIVNDIESFISDKNWTTIFGEQIDLAIAGSNGYWQKRALKKVGHLPSLCYSQMGTGSI